MSHINRRKIAIVAAVILGIVAAFYLGGVCGQLNANYQQWTADGGMTGDAVMQPPNFSPLFSIPYAFTGDGIKGVLFILVIAGGIFLYVKIHNKFSSNDLDGAGQLTAHGLNDESDGSCSQLQ